MKADENRNPDFANPEDSGHDWKAEGYVTKVTGEPTVYADGMRRDSTAGKPKFRLMWPKGVPYKDQLMYRVAALYTRGAEKYGDRNHEKSSTPESLAHHEESLERHLHQFLQGVEDGEDHAAAVVWGVNAVLVTRRNIAAKELEEAGSANAERVAGEIDKAKVRAAEKRERVRKSEAEHGRLADQPIKVFPDELLPGEEVVSASEVDRAKGERFLAKRRQFDKIYGRETAEHSAQLDLEQEKAREEGEEWAAKYALAIHGLASEKIAEWAKEFHRNHPEGYDRRGYADFVAEKIADTWGTPQLPDFKEFSQYALADQIKRWNREWSGNRRGTMGEYSEYLAGKLAERFKLSER